MNSIAKKAVVVTVAAAAIAGGVGVASAEAATSGRCSSSSATCSPRMSRDWTPWNTPKNRGASVWTISKGTRLDVKCWTTGATQLKSNRWFFVTSQAYPFTNGYVPANAVKSQIKVGHC